MWFASQTSQALALKATHFHRVMRVMRVLLVLVLVVVVVGV
jgi:hypothetical protein